MTAVNSTGLGTISKPDGSVVQRASVSYSNNRLDLKVKDEPYGTVKISKRYLWQEAEGTEQTLHAAANVQFEMYAVSGNHVNPDVDNDNSVDTLRTDSRGEAVSKTAASGLVCSCGDRDAFTGIHKGGYRLGTNQQYADQHRLLLWNPGDRPGKWIGCPFETLQTVMAGSMW